MRKSLEMHHFTSSGGCDLARSCEELLRPVAQAGGWVYTACVVASVPPGVFKYGCTVSWVEFIPLWQIMFRRPHLARILLNCARA